MRFTSALIVAALTLSAAPVDAGEGDRWFGEDKLLHYVAGTGLAAGGYAGSAWLVQDRRGRVAAGLAAGIGASAAKEWYDRSHGGTSSWRDFAWGSVGAATGVTVAWLIDRARHARHP